MTYPREVLNRLRWMDGSLDGVRITYVHRGAPEDLMTVRGEDVSDLGRSFFSIGPGRIPYHRITLIEKDGEVVFKEG